jgi:hypothetical protein
MGSAWRTSPLPFAKAEEAHIATSSDPNDADTVGCLAVGPAGCWHVAPPECSRVEFSMAPLPKSVTGKVQRKMLRDPFWTGRKDRVSGA